MDAITALALSVQNPFISAIGYLLNQDLLYGAIILGMVIAGEWKNDKRLKIFLSLAIALALALAVKQVVAEPRPCAGANWCPLDYAFPSTHAVLAFVLVASFLKKKSFPFFLAFALFVSFTRVNIGVHVFADILGAIPIALLAYYATEITWKWVEMNGWLKKLGITKQNSKGAKYQV